MARLPTDSQARKNIPLASGLVRYFPDALIEVAKVSYEGNEKHNPGEPLHWAREKSNDHADCVMRHFFDAEAKPVSLQERVEHLSALAWRSLALLQLACEELEEANWDDETRRAFDLAMQDALSDGII